MTDINAHTSEPLTPIKPFGLALHISLFFITCYSTAWMYGWFTHGPASWNGFFHCAINPKILISGLPFAIPLMIILLAHEMGHYITARIYHVDQSLPFFIPAPGTFFGTMGAIIVMRSQPPNRPALLNVAAMGPYAGLILALPAAAWGLYHSEPVVVHTLQGSVTWFGSSLLFAALEWLFSPNGSDVALHPVGMAGWVGLFITSLNLIPASQLDGGHIAYALLGRQQVWLSRLVVVILLTLGLSIGTNGGMVWIVWGVLLTLLGLRHPPVRHVDVQLSRRQKFNGMFAMLVLLLTFTPIPVQQRSSQRTDAMSGGTSAHVLVLSSTSMGDN